MMIVLIIFALLMSLICVCRNQTKGTTKFELVLNLIFGLIFLLVAIYIWKGGSL